jgi:hypothetical protein
MNVGYLFLFTPLTLILLFVCLFLFFQKGFCYVDQDGLGLAVFLLSLLSAVITSHPRTLVLSHVKYLGVSHFWKTLFSLIFVLFSLDCDPQRQIIIV